MEFRLSPLSAQFSMSSEQVRNDSFLAPSAESVFTYDEVTVAHTEVMTKKPYFVNFMTYFKARRADQTERYTISRKKNVKNWV